MRDDDYWALREDENDDVPVADLTDVRKRSRRRGPRSRRRAAMALIVALATAGIAVAAHVASDNGTRRGVDTTDRRVATNTDDGQARGDVLSALSTTTASGSFRLRYTLTSEPGLHPMPATTVAGPCTTVVIGGAMSIDASSPRGKATTGCGYPVTADPQNVTITGEGFVHVDPTAMVSTADVSGLGKITTRVDGTRVWEDGGGNYGMAPSTQTGTGALLSQFAGLVMGSLGRREGAIAMNGLASPTGYLAMANDAIGDASAHGNAVVDGVEVTVYDVTVDTMKAIDRPGLTPEEFETTKAAIEVLRREGYDKTSVQLSIDGLGFIRRANTVISFADGGTVSADTTFSDFGCSSVEMLPNGPSIVPDPTGCSTTAGRGPATTTTTATTAPSPTSVQSTTTAPGGAVAGTTIP